MVQTLAAKVPWLAVAFMKVRPAGKASLTVTPVAVLKPMALLTVNVKVTISPTAGALLLTVPVSERSIGRKPASMDRLSTPEATANGFDLPALSTLLSVVGVPGSPANWVVNT